MILWLRDELQPQGRPRAARLGFERGRGLRRRQDTVRRWEIDAIEIHSRLLIACKPDPIGSSAFCMHVESGVTRQLSRIWHRLLRSSSSTARRVPILVTGCLSARATPLPRSCPMHIDGHVYASRHLAQLESAFTVVLQRVLTEQPDEPIAWAGRALVEYASGGGQQKIDPVSEKLEHFHRAAAASRLQAQQRGRLSRTRTAGLRISSRPAEDSSAAGEVGASTPAMLAELATLLLDEQCVSTLRESFEDACSEAGAATRDELGEFLPAFVEDMGWEGVSLANIADLILRVFAVASTSGGRAISWDAFGSALREVAAPPPTRQPTCQHASRAAELHTTPARPSHSKPQPSPSSPPTTSMPRSAPSAGGVAMSPAGEEEEMNVEQVLGTMRDVLRRRAEASSPTVKVRSLSAQLARNFRICDRDHNGVLDVREFSRCVAICRLGIAERSIRRLHAAFDSDGSGMIDYDEFLHALDPDAQARDLHLESTSRGVALPPVISLAEELGVSTAGLLSAGLPTKVPTFAETLAAAGSEPLPEADVQGRSGPVTPLATSPLAGSSEEVAVGASSSTWPIPPIVPRLTNLREKVMGYAPPPQPYEYAQCDDEDDEEEAVE